MLVPLHLSSFQLASSHVHFVVYGIDILGYGTENMQVPIIETQHSIN